MKTRPITFMLDGHAVNAAPGETIWQVARRAGVTIPHLCYRDAPSYRPDGNCRACMVEIEGERVLAPSCRRQPRDGMVVHTTSARAERARRLVFELLLADQPESPHNADAPLLEQARTLGLSDSRFPAVGGTAVADWSHPAMTVRLDACIHCTLCVRACREVQVNDVIGMAGSGRHSRVVFDLEDPMGQSRCVACGECVAVCPTGALMERKRPVHFSPQRQVRSVCPYCGVGCQLTFNVRDEQIVSVDGAPGPANLNRLCVKGRFGFSYVMSPERLTTPLIRRDGAPKGLNIDPADPLTHFRPASWEEALDRAAAGLGSIRDRHQGRALAGFGSAKCSNEEAYLFQKLVRTGFGSNNVDHCTRLCHASSVAALLEGIGSGAVTAPFTAATDADVIVVIGANPTENHPVAATFFKQAAQRGAELIVMDPRAQTLARHATQMLQFTPGTDVALLNAIMHVIVEEGLYDADYIARHTRGFEAMKAHLAAYAPGHMAPICGIPETQIRAVARCYAGADAAIIFWGMGVSQHVHGTDNVRCLIALSLMCGQIGRPGTGLHPLRGQNNVQGASDAGLIPMFLPDYHSVTDERARGRFESAWDARLAPSPGLTVVEIINAAYDGEIRGMYILGENPAMSDPDVSHARAALARLEHLVVQDIFLTETAMFADVVLPATAWPEKAGTVTNTNRQVQMGRPAVDPPGEAQADWWITCELARRLGLSWNYGGPRDVYEEMAGLMPSLRHIGWDRLLHEHSVTYPCPAPGAPGTEIVFGDGFPTADGRGRFVPAEFMPPAELPDDDYPYVLVTGRQLEHWHTGAMTRRADVLDALEPGPSVQMNAADLSRLEVAPGDEVRVASRRGEVVIPVRCDNMVPPGVIFIPFAYVEAAANLLTIPELDPDGKIPEFKYCGVRVRPMTP